MAIRFCLILALLWMQGLVFGGSPGKPKNIILVIGDGMGLAQIALAEYLHKPPTALDQMEVVGLQKTHSADNLETDSGAAGTAMSCGVKTFNTAIGEDVDSLPVKNIMEIARKHGYKTGFVVTSSVVHATPAVFYAHTDSRGYYQEIARQLVNSGMDIFVGGGERYFMEDENNQDDLLKALASKGYHVIRNGDIYGQTHLDKIDPDQKIACFTAMDDPPRANNGRNYLSAASVKTIEALEERAETGYFMMIEASQVDWAGHANDEDWLAYEMQDMFDMLDGVLQKVREDKNTLLIVTGDHECGYLSIKGKKYPRLEFGSKVHSSQMVPVFATGPGAEEFLGIYDNTEIFNKMKSLLGF